MTVTVSYINICSGAVMTGDALDPNLHQHYAKLFFFHCQLLYIYRKPCYKRLAAEFLKTLPLSLKKYSRVK